MDFRFAPAQRVLRVLDFLPGCRQVGHTKQVGIPIVWYNYRDKFYRCVSHMPNASMPDPNHDRRRSERLLLDLPVIIEGELGNHEHFQEETFTVVVNAHGAVIMLAATVGLGQNLVVVNLKTQEHLEGRVVQRGPEYGGMTKVAIEFMRPAPEFWHIPSLPESWKASRA
jgi:hypothetical protein